LRWWVGGGGFALFDAADVAEFFRPGAGGFEVGDCAASGVLARGLFGAKGGFERTVGFVVALDLCQAGPTLAKLVVCVGRLRCTSCALELCGVVSV
jgi:hypothetical protein